MPYFPHYTTISKLFIRLYINFDEYAEMRLIVTRHKTWMAISQMFSYNVLSPCDEMSLSPVENGWKNEMIWVKSYVYVQYSRTEGERGACGNERLKEFFWQVFTKKPIFMLQFLSNTVYCTSVFLKLLNRWNNLLTNFQINAKIHY